MNIKEITKKYTNYIIDKRRYFHQNPEPSGKEYNTSRIVQEELSRLGIPFDVVGETAVVAKIKGPEKGKKSSIKS